MTHDVRPETLRAGAGASRWLLAVILGGVAALTAPRPAEAQPYVDARIGYASASFALDAPYNGTVDDRSTTLGITGGFGFGRLWAVEAGFNVYEGFDGRGTPCPVGGVCSPVVQNVDDNNMFLYRLGVVRRVILGNMQLYGLAGYYRARVATNINLPDDRFHENGLHLGAGARWYFREPWTISLEASRFDSNLYQVGIGIGWGIRPPERRN